MTQKDLNASIKEDAKMPATGKVSANAKVTANDSKNESLSKSVKAYKRNLSQMLKRLFRTQSS